MVEAGVLVGLPRETAATLVHQTLVGAAALLVDGTEGPEALRAAVTSPGGTTAAGLARLEAHGVRSAFLEAAEAATRPSHEIRRPHRRGPWPPPAHRLGHRPARATPDKQGTPH